MKRNQVTIIIISFVIIGGLVGAYFLIDALVPKITTAPDYDLKDVNVNGTDFTIISFQPKTLVIDFMGVTCGPCEDVYPRLADLLVDADLAGRIDVLSVNTDPYTTEQELTDYANHHNMTWWVANAPEGMVENYGVTGIPAIIIIDGNGTITYSSIVAKEEGETQPLSYDKLKEECLNAISGEEEGIQIANFLGFTIGLAIIVAITSFFSPCSFPLLPSYVAHILGIDVKKKEDDENAADTEDRKKHFGQYLIYPLLGLSSGLGILVSYLLLGVLVTAIGSVISSYLAYALPIIGVIFIIFGILMFTPFEISFSKILGGLRKQQMKIDNKANTRQASQFLLLGTFLYGLGYGIASLGCNGPIFLAFSFRVSELEAISEMIFAYLAFSLTIILLMVGVTLLIVASKDVILQKMKSATKVIKIVSGVVMIGVGIYLIIEFILGIV